MSKAVELAALQPLIFFDDNLKNCMDASSCSPTVRVPTLEVDVVINGDASGASLPGRSDRFLGVCRIYLKKTFDQHADTLSIWHNEKLRNMSDAPFQLFVEEFERSTKGTPVGRQRRAAGAKNEEFNKLMLFLENVLKKYLD